MELNKIIRKVILKYFKPGIVLECIDNKNNNQLELGKKYVVNNVENYYNHIYLNEIFGSYFPTRFKIIKG